MKYRKQRIAWSVAWGVACFLSLLIWGRSHTIHDVLKGNDVGDYDVTYESSNGSQQIVAMNMAVFRGPSAISRGPWFHLRSMSADLGGSIFAWNFHYQTTPAFMIQLNWPHWFTAVVTAFFAGLPWIAKAKRFTLRTMLIATTLVAVALGLVGWLRSYNW
jgi:hypothetical protein